MAETQIEWTDVTWNPVTGCSKITRGCDHCYAERFSERFRGVKNHPFEKGFDLTLRPERLRQPLDWRKPRRIFVNSMSDLFHKEIPRAFIDIVFDTMEQADWHTYQVLTKRSSLMSRYLNRRYSEALAPKHIWLGVSIEDEKNTVRLKHLKEAHASTKFISFEPLLGPVGSIDRKEASIDELVYENKEKALNALLEVLKGDKILSFEEVIKWALPAYMLRETDIKDICLELARDGKIKNTWSAMNKKKPYDRCAISLIS